jgi:hypothetical protein
VIERINERGRNKGESWKGSLIKRDVLWHTITFFNTPPTIIIAQTTIVFFFSPNVAINYTWDLENENNEYWIIIFLLNGYYIAFAIYKYIILFPDIEKKFDIFGANPFLIG